MSNYTIFHLHSDLSTGTTNIDSVTKYKQYIKRAKECGMEALGFSEHGNIFEWYHKKCDIETAGMKYIHGVEAYITETLDDKVRDNFHCVLIARNFDGFKELNAIVSKSFNREDNHFYYSPRISFDELINTSNNILITTGCLGGILHNGSPEMQREFIHFLSNNKNRCFLEIQHHRDIGGEQKKYNQQLLEISKSYGIPLIAGTDTHALNSEHAEARIMLQKAKGVNFSNEDDWDLTFKTYDELVRAYKLQGAIPEEEYLKAIDNTNLLADLIEPFELDTHTKYPKIYENSYDMFKSQINNAYKGHKYMKSRYTKAQVSEMVKNELDTYEKTGAIDFMILQTYLRNWEREHGIYCGYGRGSVSGSEIAYILGITEMDSAKFNLNFFRFLNPSRVSNADIDTDYSSKDRDKVKEFILKDHMNLDNIRSSEIITFNTIQMKGAIKDIGRALGMPIQETQQISNMVTDNEIPNEYRDMYPELFKYVDIVMDVIVSVGSHPSGVLVSDLNIDEMVGMCTLSTSKYPVSCLNMKELDALMYIKLDILGLDNIGVINDTCKLVGIERLTPDNVDLNDENVWKSIRDDTTLIFQWESNSAQSYLKKFMSDETISKIKPRQENFSWLKWFSFGNGLIRPGCASFRDDVAKGNILITGFGALDDFLLTTSGRITMQEDIMKFLVKFCGYSDAESDTVRRGIAKKYGTEKFIDEIHDRFVQYSNKCYGEPKDNLEKIFPPIKQGILDATRYAFSWNHSDSYSCIGYICGYLRYYYPYEFTTAALNTFENDKEKTNNIIKFAQKNDIKIEGIKFRHSKSEYIYDKRTKTIYKGMNSIKYINKRISQELYNLKDKKFNNFFELLRELNDNTSVDSRQLEILIKLDFFSEFGEIKELILKVELFNMFYNKKILKIEDLKRLGLEPEWVADKFNGTLTNKQLRGINIIEFINYLASVADYPKTSIIDKINYEQENLGYINIKIPSTDISYAYVLDVNKKYKNKVVKLYRLKTGEIESVKIRAKVYDSDPIEIGDVIKTLEKNEERKWIPIDPANGKFERSDEIETILYRWKKIQC